jgi:hypothetical protein
LPDVQSNEKMLPEDILQANMLKICAIKARIFHAFGGRGHTKASELRALQEELQAFHSELPGWMTMDQLLAAESNESLRSIIFYVHLFYLSATMLLHRKLLSKLVSVEEQSPVPINNVPEHIQQGIADGLLAAKTAARLFNLLQADGNIAQICWLCM